MYKCVSTVWEILVVVLVKKTGWSGKKTGGDLCEMEPPSCATLDHSGRTSYV